MGLHFFVQRRHQTQICVDKIYNTKGSVVKYSQHPPAKPALQQYCVQNLNLQLVMCEEMPVNNVGPWFVRNNSSWLFFVVAKTEDIETANSHDCSNGRFNSKNPLRKYKWSFRNR